MQAWQTFLREVLGRPEESVKLVVPAAVYAFQNNILYEALTYLDSVTYQVTYQLKILTTALFSVLVLGRALQPRQWVALVMLTVGVTIVQVFNNFDWMKNSVFEAICNIWSLRLPTTRLTPRIHPWPPTLRPLSRSWDCSTCWPRASRPDSPACTTRSWSRAARNRL